MQTNRDETITALVRKHLGLGPSLALAILGTLASIGLVAGVMFPKFEATALLQFPEAQKVVERFGEPRLSEQRPLDPKANLIELAAYKRVAASYNSASQLSAYLMAVGSEGRPAALRLLALSENPAFWDRAAAPILPFSRRDQKEFGDIRDASATSILGLELTADARSESVAQDMIGILAEYYVNAVVRERIRAWTLAGKVDARSLEKGVRADILRAELDIELYARRAEDMKVVLARYPDAARMDARQIVSVNPTEGGERYLSPLAQLVGAESAISQRRELIRRWQRDLKQKGILAKYYAEADALIDREIEITRLLTELRALAAKAFSHAESAEEWSKEAALRVNGALDNFEVMRSQFGVRNGIRAGEVPSRSPWRMAAIGFVAGLALLGALAFLRATLLATKSDHDVARDDPDRA
jgi:hypothetical protein